MRRGSSGMRSGSAWRPAPTRSPSVRSPVAAGLVFWQTMALSLLMFTGGSQFALVGVIAGGGNPLAGAATAVMLGSRNALYGMRLAPLLQVRGWRRWTGAQLVIDESTAMAIGPDSSGPAGSASTPPACRCSCCGTSVPRPGRWVPMRCRIRACSVSTPPWRARSSALLGPRLRGREAVGGGGGGRAGGGGGGSAGAARGAGAVGRGGRGRRSRTCRSGR